MTHLFVWGKNKWKKQIDHWLNRCTIVDLFSILFQWEGNEFEAWVNNFIQIICQPKAQVGALVHRNARTVNKIVTQSELYCHGEQFQDWPTGIRVVKSRMTLNQLSLASVSDPVSQAPCSGSLDSNELPEVCLDFPFNLIRKSAMAF